MGKCQEISKEWYFSFQPAQPPPQPQQPQQPSPHQQPPQPPQPQQQQPLHPIQTAPPAEGGDTLSVLRERKTMYGKAIQQAQSEGASSKVRRFQRGLKVS